MNMDEKSILDEVWDAVGLDRKESLPKEEKKEDIKPIEEDIPVKAEEIEEIQENLPEIEEIQEETEAEEPAPLEEEPAPAPAEEAPTPQELVIEKKKDVRFLVIYTIAFVVVISLLIGGSYLITSRIHREMAEDNELMNSSQSTLKNIQEENRLLKEQNQTLKQENEQLIASSEENNALLESVGDMVEMGEYLSAAQDAYIKGNRTLARTILSAIDREKLSQPAKAYYDTLNGRLN